MNKRIIRYMGALMLLAAPIILSSCDEGDDFDTNQYVGGVNLNSFGPSPVSRGGELRFLGSGMNQITKINIPGSGDVTDITVIDEGEIRITVPQDAEPGYLTLYYSGGEITTKTMLTYTETITIESIEPLRVKPGESITITGDYLNLMSQVCFSFVEGGDSVNVDEDQFLKHERSTIVVTVPEEAVSGVIAVSDVAETPNMVKSEDEIEVILPSVSEVLDLTDVVPGTSVTIEGSDLDLVRTVRMPNGDDVDFTYTSADAETITFTIPDEVTDGSIVVIPASGVEVEVATIGVVVPTNVVAEPYSELRGGMTITITGDNIDQVSTVSFPNVADAVSLKSSAADKIEVEFPAMAQSGEATLNLKSGKTVGITLSTAKPKVDSFSPSEVSAADNVTLKGENLDLVASIVFGGDVTVVVEDATETEITVTVPASAVTGQLTLNMANGEQVTTTSLTVNTPICAYISTFPEESFTAGDLFVALLENADMLTSVTVNSTAVQYIINNSTLYLTLPVSCGYGTVLTLISSNGEISYTFDVTPTSVVEITAYDDGARDLGSWAGEDAGGAFRIYKSAFTDVPSGAMLVFYVEPYGDYSQIQINDANWSQFEIVEFNVGVSTIEWELTEDRLDHILNTSDGWSTTGLVIQGCNTIVNKVTIQYTGGGSSGGSSTSKEVTIWEGSWTCSGWDGNQDLAWGGYDWDSVSAGQILRVYMTPTVSDDSRWCLSLRHGNNWGNIPGISTQFDNPTDNKVELELTSDILADIIDNGGLVITGDGFVLNKVTIE